MILFLGFIIFLILTILLVSLVTYFNSKNQNEIVKEKTKIIGNISVNNLRPRQINVKGKGTINWGDGAIDTFDSLEEVSFLHDYALGDYTITIEGEILSVDFGIQNNYTISLNNIEIINPVNLEKLIVNFSSILSSQYFIKGLEQCSVLKYLALKNAQGVLTLPAFQKLLELSIFDSYDLTKIENLLSNTKSLISLNITSTPLSSYIEGGVFDTTIFEKLKNLVIGGTHSDSIDTLILKNTIEELRLLDFSVNDVINFDISSYSNLYIQNVSYFDTISSFDFSLNNNLYNLGLYLNNPSDVDITLPNIKTVLTDLDIVINNSSTNTITDVNDYTNLATLTLRNFYIVGDILNISSLDKLQSLNVFDNTYTDITLSSSISELKSITINNNQIQLAELDNIGNTILTQCTTYNLQDGSIDVSGNPGVINTNASPWSVLHNTYNWYIEN